MVAGCCANLRYVLVLQSFLTILPLSLEGWRQKVRDVTLASLNSGLLLLLPLPLPLLPPLQLVSVHGKNSFVRFPGRNIAGLTERAIMLAWGMGNTALQRSQRSMLLLLLRRKSPCLTAKR